MSCAFCEIAEGKIAGAIVFEDDDCLAFLDRRPLFPGHCLLIPREHHETLLDLPAALIAPLFANMQLLARAVKQGMAADGVFIGINNEVSQSVPHLHIHVVPRKRGDGLRGFFWPRYPYPNDEALRKAQESVRSAFTQLKADSPKETRESAS